MPPKATAKINGKVIAESDQYATVEGNIYVSPVIRYPAVVYHCWCFVVYVYEIEFF